MLILTRKIGERLVADGDIFITVLGVKGNTVSIGIDAPDDVIIDREEIHKKRISGEWKEDK